MVSFEEERGGALGAKSPAADERTDKAVPISDGGDETAEALGSESSEILVKTP